MVERIWAKFPDLLEYAADNKVRLTKFDLDVIQKLYGGKQKDKIKNFLADNHRDFQCLKLHKRPDGNSDSAFLNWAIGQKDLVKLIDGKCFASIQYIGAHQINKDHVKKLNEKVFTHIDIPLQDTYYEGMTEGQIKHWQEAKHLAAFRGDHATMKLHKVNKKAFEKCPAPVFQNWVSSNAAIAKIPGKHIELVKVADHLRKADYAIYTHLRNSFADVNGKSAWTKAKPELVNHIAADHRISYTLHPDAIKADTTVNARSFSFMRAEVQGAVLHKVKNLPENILSGLIEKDIKDLKYTDNKNSDNSCTGYECFTKMEKKKKGSLGKILAPILEFVCIDKHWSHFSSDNKDMFTIGKYMTRSCFKELQYTKADVKNLGEKLPEAMLQFIHPTLVKKFWDDEDKAWLELAEHYLDDKSKQSAWRGFLSNPKMHVLVDLKTFEKLEKKKLDGAMDAFSSQLLRQMADFDKLPQKYIQKIGDKIYVRFTKADAAKIDYAKSTVTQLGNASSEVENVADHYAASLSAEGVKKVPTEVFPVMNEGWFLAMTEDAYSGISKEQFAGAAPEKITKVTAAQASKLDPEVAKALTPEQISTIGNHAGPKSDPEMAMLKVLEAVSGGFNEFQMKAFKARQAESSGAISAAGASLMALAASMALIFPLL